jgi:hypothetical protein
MIADLQDSCRANAEAGGYMASTRNNIGDRRDASDQLNIPLEHLSTLGLAAERERAHRAKLILPIDQETYELRLRS